MNLLIRKAKVISETSDYHNKIVDLIIIDGFISEIANNLENKGKYKEITYPNLHISIGWFDSSVSVGEPGFEERDTIENTLNTAAYSGFTGVAINSNNNPQIDNHTSLSYMTQACKANLVDTFIIAALTVGSKGKEMTEIYDMKAKGAIAFADYNKAIIDDNLMKICLEYSKMFNALIFGFSQNNSIARDGLVNEEYNSTRLGLKGIPALAEELQIMRDLFLLEYTESRLHIPSVSTKKSIELIREAKKKGLKVSCGVAVANLCLNDDLLNSFDSNTKILPPLRTSEDIKALIEALEDDTIDIIHSDHNPIDIEHKKIEYDRAQFGSIGLESAFIALNKNIDLKLFLDKISTKPRELFGLEIPEINKGVKANITLFDPEGERIFDRNEIMSNSENSVFLTEKVKGRVYGVVNGNKSKLKEI